MSYVENQCTRTARINYNRKSEELCKSEAHKWWELLLDYRMRFKSAQDNLKSHISGRLHLKKLAESQPEWNTTTNTNTINIAYKIVYKSFVSMLYLDTANQSKCGTILSRLATQYLLWRQVKTISKGFGECTPCLEQYKFDLTYTNWKRRRSSDIAHQKERQHKPPKATVNSSTPIEELWFAQMEKRSQC